MDNQSVLLAKIKILTHQSSVYHANHNTFQINKLLNAKSVIHNVQNVQIKAIIVLVASLQIKLHQHVIVFSNKQIYKIYANVIISVVLVVLQIIIFVLHALLKKGFYLTANVTNSTKKFNKNVLKQKYSVLISVQVVLISVTIAPNALKIESILLSVTVLMDTKNHITVLVQLVTKALIMILCQKYVNNVLLNASHAIISNAFSVCLDFKSKAFFATAQSNNINLIVIK
ncbi:transmembrane protein, putative (macronuclear) [Tetrahymena thermophila SB210]|uniref:Transmembrane protein, putative n=1 Tax=Tetrahymena thermophila (strain SB210) TaxID=312017 RepID=W7X6D7_TETTS|nr:transmembrane protein, putative [Tetrahymena thermophila SB210]EWS72972.1 transmembrane protein, putative [Tetrahymena thermophila SB210]|eukprot:XP_012654505.1 transmembrane protein, putative [Tetrahymena thermophila SB210]